MNALEALLLGVVQGLTEFLPVSSSGHLLLVQEQLGLEQSGLLFALALHIGSLGSVLIFYRARVAELLAGVLRRRPEELGYVAKLAVATLPAVAVVLVFGDAIDGLFTDSRLAAVCLLLTGAILWTTRATLPGADVEVPGWGAALLIGCAQAFAILPGISRSGATVAAALALRISPVAAAEFSFLMSAVAITGGALRSATELANASDDVAAALSLGGVASFLSGIVAIWLFVRLLRTRHFYWFAYYVWPVGALFLFWITLRA